MPTADLRVYLTHSQTGETRALSPEEAQKLRLEMWPVELYSCRHIWDETQPLHKAHLMAADPNGQRWTPKQLESAMKKADPAAVARIAENGFHYDPATRKSSTTEE